MTKQIFYFWGIFFLLMAAAVRGAEPGQTLANYFDDDDSEAVNAGSQTVQSAFKVTVEMDRADSEYISGENFRLKIWSELPGYIYIYSIANGEASRIFPNDHFKANQIDGGVKLIFPAMTSPFAWKVDGKAGTTEKIAVIVAERPLDVKGLDDIDLGFNESDLAINRAVVVPNFKIARAVTEYSIVEKHGGTTTPQPGSGSKRVAGLFFHTHEYDFKEKKAKRDRNFNFRIGDMLTITNTLNKYCQMDEIVLVTQENFVKSKIKEAYQHLADVTKPGDTIFLFWECHGGNEGLRDTSGRESDSQHEYFALYDISDADHPEGFIQDDEFAEMLKVFEGRKVMIMLEICHSGGAIEERASRALNDIDFSVSDIRKLSERNFNYSCIIDDGNKIMGQTSSNEMVGNNETEEFDTDVFDSFFKNTEVKEIPAEQTLSSFFSNEEDEGASSFVNSISRMTKESKDISLDTPNIAIICSCSKTESSLAAIILDKDHNYYTISDDQNYKWAVSPMGFSFLCAVTDTEGKVVRNKNVTMFEDIWNYAKVFLPAHAQRYSKIFGEDFKQMPVYLNNIGDIEIRPAQ